MPPLLQPGEPAPWFHAVALDGNPRFAFNTVAGRWIVMLMLGSGGRAEGRAALQTVADHRNLFDDQRASLFGVTIDPSDAGEGRIAPALPGIRWFLDYDRAISTAYRAMETDGGTGYAPHWLLLDPMLRVYGRAALADGGALLADLRRLADAPPPVQTAPVLVVPNVLSPQLCRSLIALYAQHGGEESGFMREENGITVARTDATHKRRADCHLEDARLIALLKGRINAALRPMIQRAFQFDPTRIERFMVGCYDAADGGHFRAHRDNTTKGTAHRRFACTINLNADAFEGGDLSFPEFGPQQYRAPTGGAVVFSCSLLHAVAPVTRGRRYAFLPFFYDDAAAELRERNLVHVAPELQQYRMGSAEVHG